MVERGDQHQWSEADSLGDARRGGIKNQRRGRETEWRAVMLGEVKHAEAGLVVHLEQLQAAVVEIRNRDILAIDVIDRAEFDFHVPTPEYAVADSRAWRPESGETVPL